MSTKQLLAEIERGINALQKARVLCLKGQAVAPKAKAAAAKGSRINKQHKCVVIEGARSSSNRHGRLLVSG